MGKFKTKDEAKEALAKLKEERKAAYDELRTFEKENGLAKATDHSGDKKNGKKWSKLNEVYTKKKTRGEEIQKEIDEFKAAKTPRQTTYDYPKNEAGKEMNAAEKKKYRTKMRAAKKKAEKDKDKGTEKKADSSKKSGDKKKSDKKAGDKKADKPAASQESTETAED